jgi:hypothetical protein
MTILLFSYLSNGRRKKLRMSNFLGKTPYMKTPYMKFVSAI